MLNSKFSQKGVSLYLTLVVLSIILAIVVGLSGILVSQMKMIRGMENSVVALYAADTGIEKVLKVAIEDPELLKDEYDPESLDIGASYEVRVSCCATCLAAPSGTCPDSLEIDSACSASRFCIHSVGSYKGAKRAIEVKF